MKKDEASRRDFLKAAGVGASVLGAPLLAGCAMELDGEDATEFGELRQAAGETPHDKKIFSKYFYIEVKGVYGKVPGVTQCDAGKVTMTVEECTQGDKPDYREYTYGSHEYDDLTLTLQTGPGNVKLQEWADKAMKSGGAGNALRRDISMYLLARDKSTVLRTINCFGCYPISLNAGDHSTGSDVKTITLTCNVSRIEVA